MLDVVGVVAGAAVAAVAAVAVVAVAVAAGVACAENSPKECDGFSRTRRISTHCEKVDVR